jgi:hypothetical protein
MIKESGELFIFFENMTGNWEKDKVKFCDNYDDVMGSLNNEHTIDDINKT